MFTDKPCSVDTVQKRKHGLWSESALQNALDDVIINHMPVRQAALLHNIPRQTLHDHLNSGVRVKKRPGRDNIFTESQEKDLVKQIKRSLKKGERLTMKKICKQAFLFCEEHNIKHYFNGAKSTAGRTWLKGFRLRNEDILKYKNK